LSEEEYVRVPKQLWNEVIATFDRILEICQETKKESQESETENAGSCVVYYFLPENRGTS